MSDRAKRDPTTKQLAQCRRISLALYSTYAALALLLITPSATRAQSPPPTRLTIGYVEIADDARYEPLRAYERLILKAPGRPFTGAEVGVDETMALARLTATQFALDRITVKTADEIGPAVLAARQQRQIQFILADLPAEGVRRLASAIKGQDVLAFNVSAADDDLRRQLCVREIVHTMPSRAMLMDGLVQFLVSRKWRDLLALEGPLPEDAREMTAFAASAKKLGARIVGQPKFKTGNDPRERESNNPALLTAINRDYDAVFVADHAFEFAREVPYHVSRPRPVVGSIDLEPVAWAWTWERNGAPQLNSRFVTKSGGRRMESADWAAWIAVKLVAQSVLRTRSTEFAKLRAFMLGFTEGFDGAKGLAVSVRPWDQQLRQPILLATPWAVTASAPVDGFLHQKNVLDTLGDDEADTPCHLNR